MSPLVARRLFVGSIIVYAGVVVAAAFLLPDRVPLHFDGSGVPDSVGSRLEALVVFVVLGAGLAALFGGIGAWAPRIPLTYLSMSAASKDWWSATAEREDRMRRRVARDAWELGAATMLLLAAVCAATVRAARSTDPSLDAWFWGLVGVYVVVVAAWSVRSVRDNRPEG